MFAQGVGANLNTWFQNAGQGFQTFTHNVGNGFQNVTQLFAQKPVSVVQEPQTENDQQSPGVQQSIPIEAQGKYFIIIPMSSAVGINKNELKNPIAKEKDMSFDGDILFSTYP